MSKRENPLGKLVYDRQEIGMVIDTVCINRIKYYIIQWSNAEAIYYYSRKEINDYIKIYKQYREELNAST